MRGRCGRRRGIADIAARGPDPRRRRLRPKRPRSADARNEGRRHPSSPLCLPANGLGGGSGDRTHARARRAHGTPAGDARLPRGQRDAASASARKRVRRPNDRSWRRSRAGSRRRRRSGGRRGVADRIGNRSRLRGGLRPRPRRGRWPLRGQERKRIEVALRIDRAAHSEVDVGHRQLRLAARADGAYDLALRDGVAAPDGVRPEVHERDRVAVRRRDRQRLATDRHRPREGDRAGDRRLHPGTARRADVDSAVLSGGVRVLAVEREECQHRAVHGPAPAQGGRRDDQHRDGNHRR
jgi:hypothetical protein